MIEFDGTNTLLDALGDEPTLRDVTLTNQGAVTVVEPLTGAELLPSEPLIIRVKGDSAFAQLQSNIEQINALKQSEVILFSFEIVNTP